jgi:hypothetical protein
MIPIPGHRNYLPCPLVDPAHISKAKPDLLDSNFADLVEKLLAVSQVHDRPMDLAKGVVEPVHAIQFCPQLVRGANGIHAFFASNTVEGTTQRG